MGRRNTIAILIMVALALAGLSTAPAAAAQEPCIPPPSGMVAWWPGDANTDEIVGARDGSIVASAGQPGSSG